MLNFLFLGQVALSPGLWERGEVVYMKCFYLFFPVSLFVGPVIFSRLCVGVF